MKLTELVSLLRATGYPVAYSHFTATANNPVPKPPYITYLTPYTTNFRGDNRVIHKITNVDIELYTDKKDLEAEAIMEDLFDENEIPYDSTETYIESENVFQRIYEVRLI